MDRKDFLKLVGAGAPAALILYCIGCSKSNSPAITAPQNVNFTLDLTAPANSALKNNGGFLYSNGVIVAKTINGMYVAVSQACTHQGTSVQYQSSNNSFYCPTHGSDFSTSGAVITGPATQPLQQYNVSLTGNNLRVYS